MRLRGPKLLARKYEKPEKIGSIYVNPAWRIDNSRSLWEVVESTEEANSVLGVELEPDWILITSPNSGVLFEHREATEIFLLAASSVLRIVPWTSDALPLTGTRVQVELEAPETEQGGVILAQEDAAPTSGYVVEVGDDVKEVAVGDRVFFTRFSGTKIEVQGRPHLILDEASILGLVSAEASIREA